MPSNFPAPPARGLAAWPHEILRLVTLRELSTIRRMHKIRRIANASDAKQLGMPCWEAWRGRRGDPSYRSAKTRRIVDANTLFASSSGVNRFFSHGRSFFGLTFAPILSQSAVR